MFAASSGLNVDAITEMADRMTRITSRFHKGQFYIQISFRYLFLDIRTHQRVIRIVTWLGDKSDRYRSTPVILNVGVDLRKPSRSTDIIKDVRCS